MDPDLIWRYGLAVFATVIGLAAFVSSASRSEWIGGFFWGIAAAIQWYVALHPRPTKPVDPARLMAVGEVITVASTVVAGLALGSMMILLYLHYFMHVL